MTRKSISSTSLPFDREGHRGCRGLMPENTIPAMLHALDLGVTTLEMDAVISRDRQVVISHEPFFNHEITTRPDGSYITEAEAKQLNIYRMDYEEIKRYDVGMKAHPRFPEQKKMRVVKPLLAHLIDSVENHRGSHLPPPVCYNIETKCNPSTDYVFHPGPEEFVDLLIGVIESKGIWDRVIIQSFDFRTLRYLHRKYPDYKASMLAEADDKRNLDEQLSELGFLPGIYSPEMSLVNKELVDQCHRRNMKVIPWTVNETAQMKELKALGVDGLISDYPNLFASALSR